MRTRHIFPLLMLFCEVIAASAQDSIPVRELEELIVTSERQWIEDGAINAIPTRKEKNLSNSPSTLIKSMHLPYLVADSGNITTLSGEAVTIYINGEKADEIDLANFWPKNVKKVQYMQYVSDPKYHGERNVLNFVIAGYETGGVTKLDFDQSIPLSGSHEGDYRVSSKAVYKKMTYGAMIYAGYRRDRGSSVRGETRYSDLYYDGRFYDEIVRSESGEEYGKEENINCSINAKYSGTKVQMTHTLALGWNRNPGSGGYGTDIWSDNLFYGSSSSYVNSSKNISPQFTGTYEFRFTDKWLMLSRLGYSYARNDGGSSSQFGDAEPVVNNIREDIHTANFNIVPTFRLSEKWQFQFGVKGKGSWYSTIYDGTANTVAGQNRQELVAAISALWMPLRSVGLYLQPALTSSFWTVGEIHDHELNPIVSASAWWDISRKTSVSFSTDYHMFSPAASDRNPVPVKYSDLMWSTGDPFLKSPYIWTIGLQASCLPADWCSISGRVMYHTSRNNVISAYRPASPDKGGLIMERSNGPANDDLYMSFSLRGSFFNDDLSVGLNPQWRYVHIRDSYYNHMSKLRISGDIDYTSGNCNFAVSYAGPQRFMSDDGSGTSWQGDSWNFTFTYGNGNLYLSCSINDIFHTRAQSLKRYRSAYYSTSTDSLNAGRSVSINLTYTFDYGKKTDRNIEISGPGSIESSVLSPTR